MRLLFYLLFFASGASALIYEVSWVRLLSVDLGNTVIGMSIILSVFMGGLACGSCAFGRRVDRSARPLAVYAGIELAIGVYALLFLVLQGHMHRFAVWLLQDRIASNAYTVGIKSLLAIAVLLPPTTLIGGTFPVLAKLINDVPYAFGRRLGSLYGWNTLGAVAGCLGEAFVLVPCLGIRESILVAAAINLAIGVVSGALTMTARPARLREASAVSNRLRSCGTSGLASESSSENPGKHDGQSKLVPISSELHRASNLIAWKTNSASMVSYPKQTATWLFYAVAFGSGFVVLATEVCWTRLLSNFLTGNVLVVATVLGAFLAGLALGSFLVSIWVDRVRRFDVAAGVILLASSLWLALSVAAQSPLANVFDSLLRQDIVGGLQSASAALIVLFLVVLMPATTFGAVMPLLLRWATTSLATLGRDVGRLMAVNTLGGIVGPVLGGFGLISLVGVNGSLLALAILCVVLALCAFRYSWVGLVVSSVSLGGLVFFLVPQFQQPVFWFNGGFREVVPIPRDETLFLKEGVESTVGVAQHDGVLMLTVNGLVVAETSRRDLWDLLMKAHLPMLLHENPRRVALVGLGAGVSLGAVASYDVDRIDCIEISPDVVAAQEFFRAFSRNSLNDPRVHLWVNDGRHFLTTVRRRYDVISVDPVDPPVCNLYTQDFFQLCHDRLAPDGLMVQWVPLFHLSWDHVRIIARAFVNVFPETTLWYDGTSVLLVGWRDGPLSIDVSRFFRRTEQTRVRDSFDLIDGPHPVWLLASYVVGPDRLTQVLGTNVPEHTDDRPYLEYAVLLDGRLTYETFARNLERIVTHFVPNDPSFSLVNATSEETANLLKAREMMQQFLAIRIGFLQGKTDWADRQLEQVVQRFDLSYRDLKLLSPFIGGPTTRQ